VFNKGNTAFRFYANLKSEIVKKYFLSNQYEKYEPIDTVCINRIREYELGFNNLILFNYNCSSKNTQKRFIQKATVLGHGSEA